MPPASLVRPLSVTLGLLLLWFVARSLPPYGVDTEVVAYALDIELNVWNYPSDISWAALGLAPWIGASVLVELVALAVVPWRPLRFHRAGRKRLTKVGIGLGLVFAVVQSYSTVTYLMSLNSYGEPVLWGGASALAAAGSLVIGAALCLLLAHLMTRFGLGNGFSVLLGTGALLGLVRDAWAMVDGVSIGRYTLLEALLFFAVVAGAFALVWLWSGRAPQGGFPRPGAGTLPFQVASSVLMLPMTLAAFVAFDTSPFYPGGALYTAIFLVVSLLSTVGFVWLFYRPAVTKAALAGTTDDDARVLHGAALRSALLFTVLMFAATWIIQRLGLPLAGIQAILAAVVLRDVAAEARFRRRHADVTVCVPFSGSISLNRYSPHSLTPTSTPRCAACTTASSVSSFCPSSPLTSWSLTMTRGAPVKSSMRSSGPRKAAWPAQKRLSPNSTCLDLLIRDAHRWLGRRKTARIAANDTVLSRDAGSSQRALAS